MGKKSEKQTIIRLDTDLFGSMTGFDSARVLTPAHRKIARHYASPLLLGPEVSDVLLEMVMHMYTEDEADLVAHLPPLRPRTAQKISAKSGRSLGDVNRVMDRLALKKNVILAAGTPRRYTILPIVPGTFEMALMTADVSTRNQWHKKFAMLFEQLWDQGFLAEYVKGSRPPVRYLPVHGVTDTLQKAWPSDMLEELLEPYDLFAIGYCQCRMAMHMAGKGCDKPMEVCVGIGPMAQPVIDRNLMRKAERQEILDVKRMAEENGLVTWMMNEMGDPRGNLSCSCCKCCCHALRTVSEFNAPGAFSKPHFMPVQIPEKCNLCQKCAKVCPTNAWSKNGDTMVFDPVRCIGCGLCVVSCKFDALELMPVEDAQKPEESWAALLARMLPGYAANSVRVFAKRLFRV